MKQTIVGWDIGGAHLKAVMIEPTGNVIKVVQIACPLWRGLDMLELAIDEALVKFNHYNPKTHAITMTGELADIFLNRHEGVLQIIHLIHTKLKGTKHYYAGQLGFMEFGQVVENTTKIASANWIASATFIAQQHSQALFIDMGSTTTDLMLIVDHKLNCRGFDDAMRMQYEELVYTGMIRTPLMAVASKVPFTGDWCNVAAENFATMGDVYRLTGDLTDSQDISDTADGRSKTLIDSARRLARMIGHDVEDADMTAWIALAQVFKQMQLHALKKAVMRQLSRLASFDQKALLNEDSPIIGAGVGVEIVKALAQQLNQPFFYARDMICANSLAEKNWVSICFPAYSVANLVINS